MTFALITAGISLVSGLINLIAGLDKEGEGTELIFGIILYHTGPVVSCHIP